MKLTTTTQVSVDGVKQRPGGPEEDERGRFERADVRTSTTRPRRSWMRSPSAPTRSADP
jgi:hypothetical protein